MSYVCVKVIYKSTKLSRKFIMNAQIYCLPVQSDQREYRSMMENEFFRLGKPWHGYGLHGGRFLPGRGISQPLLGHTKGFLASFLGSGQQGIGTHGS